jgi:hypothetical protein
MKKIVGICIFFIVSIMACSQEGYGFESPEDVVKYLVQNIKTGNFENAMKTSVYYYDDNIDKLNAEEYIKWIKAIMFGTPLNVPKEYHSIIKVRFLGQHAMNIQMFVASLLLPEEFNDFLQANPLLLNDNEQLLDKYLSSLSNIKSLNSLELVRMDISNPESQFSDRYKQRVESQKLCYNFDEAIEYTVLFNFNGKYYWGGYNFFRYNNNWYISSYNAILAGQSSFGTVEQISGIEEYLYEFDIDKK